MTSSPGPEDEVPRLRAALEDVVRALAGLGDRPSAAEPPAGLPAAAASDDATLLAALDSVTTAPLAGADVSALAAGWVARWARADRAMVLLAEGGRLVARAALGFRRDDLERVAVEPGDGLVADAFRTGRLAGLHDGRPAADDPFIQQFPVAEAVAVPVRGEDVVLGVLFAGRRSPTPFTGREIAVLTVIAERVGAALEARTVRRRRSGDMERLASLRAFVAGAGTGRDLRAVLARAAEVAPALLGVPVAFVALPASAEALTVVAAHGPAAPSLFHQGLRRDRGAVGEAMASGEPRAIGDVAAQPDAAALLDAGLGSCLVLPLSAADQVAGVLVLGDPAPREFSPQDVALGGVLATLVAGAIANHRTVDDLRAALLRMSSAQERLVQAERARALGGLAAGLARELSQVFARIVGKSQWLLGRAQDESVREALAALEEAAWQGADIVRRLEGLGGAAAGAGELTDARTAAEDALAQLRARAGAGGRPRVDLAPELDSTPAVAVPSAALREAILGLLLNAVDAMPAGGRLSVTTRERDGGAELIVADTGQGMPEDVRARIFDPFFTTRADGRLGLGLTVVHGLVNRHAGRIDVASRVGVGTIVTVWLPPSGKRPAAGDERPAPAAGVPSRDNGHPATTAPALPPAPTPESHGAVDGGTRPPAREATVLVLEEDEAARAALVESLRGAGYRAVSAPDAPSGLAMAEAVRFDLVLADLALRQRSGLAVARAVKRASPHTAVVLMADWGHLLDPERLREQGVDLLLVKPFRADRLLAVVEEALRLRPLA